MKHTLLSFFAALFLCAGAFGQAHDHDHDHARDHAHDHDHDHNVPALPADFAEKLDLSQLRTLSLQDRQTIKTWDTYARQMVAAIAGRSTVDDQEPLFTVLDISFRPDAYLHKNILKIKNVPLRKDFAEMPGLPKAEAERILNEGTVNPEFWMDPETQTFLRRLQQEAMWKSDAIGQVQSGANALQQLMKSPNHFLPAAVVPAKTGDWHTLLEMTGNVVAARPTFEAIVKNWQLREIPPPLSGYDNEQIAQINDAAVTLLLSWNQGDAAMAQQQVDRLVKLLPAVEADIYPGAAKRKAEVLYNKLYKLTLPGAAIYFVAFTLFLVAAYSQGPRLRQAGVVFMVLGLALHVAGVGVRWWLDQKSTGDWFHSIPIKNQFESVMMSALFGIVVGLALEIWRKKSLFGAAACFVGWMSLIALFTVPYVFGKDIGGEIGRVNGILMSYWLYIHVTLATAAYALIGMSFLLGVWWLLKYVKAPAAIHAMRGNLISSDAAEPGLAPGTLRQGSTGAASATSSAAAINPTIDPIESARAFFARLDACNLVILQLAFWILLVAIICGAIWADVSWGRPWGWDPKETFALVTWIVYLVVIHVRLVTVNKALWTAILSVIGFFIMLFNWIGVNYFLVGLHSYA
jgi:cytochrome c-type biogenesis protein CcsB